MRPDQMKSAASELRARANMLIGDPAGERCLAFAKQLETLAEQRPVAYVHQADLHAVAEGGVASGCTLGSSPVVGLVPVYVSPASLSA